jgi:ribosomal protein S18 acetylase RimI-like enzyme
LTGLDPTRLWRRPESEADLPFLFDLYASTRTRELSRMDWSEKQKAQFVASQFQAQWVDYHGRYPDARFEVVELDGERVGRLIVHQREDELRLIDIAVAPAYRDRGIGTHLIGEVLDEARDLGLAVRFHVEESNPARRLYDRLGFVEIAQNGPHRLLQWGPEE